MAPATHRPLRSLNGRVVLIHSQALRQITRDSWKQWRTPTLWCPDGSVPPGFDLFSALQCKISPLALMKGKNQHAVILKGRLWLRRQSRSFTDHRVDTCGGLARLGLTTELPVHRCL